MSSSVNIAVDRERVIYDVANLAYIIGDVREGHYTPHSLHHVFDICATGNIDRVNAILDLAIAEVDAYLPLQTATQLSGYCVAALHEYLVTRVMSDWLETAFPSTGADAIIGIWREKRDAAKEALLASLRATLLASTPYAFTRTLPPI